MTMAKSWVFGLLTLTIMLGLIGLLAFTSESVHRVVAPVQPPEAAPAPAPAVPPVEPEMGPMFHGNGLMLTY